jgi:hypothetical protein
VAERAAEMRRRMRMRRAGNTNKEENLLGSALRGASFILQAESWFTLVRREPSIRIPIF